MGKDEITFLIIFGTTITLWLTQSLTNLETAFVSMLATTLFFLPGIEILDWQEAKQKKLDGKYYY